MLRRLDRLAHACQLVHQRLVDVEAAGRVHITTSRPSAFARSRPSAAARTGSASLSIDGNRDLLAELLQLVDRRGTLQVGRHEPGLLPLAAQMKRELGRRGGLAGPLQAGHQDDRGRAPERELGITCPHQPREAVVHQLDDLLTRVQALEDVVAERVCLHTRDELLHDLEVDVGLEERQPDLAHRLVDGVLVEAPGAAELTQG